MAERKRMRFEFQKDSEGKWTAKIISNVNGFIIFNGRGYNSKSGAKGSAQMVIDAIANNDFIPIDNQLETEVTSEE